MLYFGSSMWIRREKSRDFAQHLEFLKPSYDFPLTFTHYVFAPRTLITYDWNFRFYYALLAGLTSTSWVEGMKMSCSGKIIRLTQV